MCKLRNPFLVVQNVERTQLFTKHVTRARKDNKTGKMRSFFAKKDEPVT